MISKRLLSVALVFAATAYSLRAAEFSSLEERMSHAEFEAAGLSKLSADELAALNNWLRGAGLSTADTTVTAVPDTVGFPAGTNEPDLVVSQINGSFKGWDGETVFHLANGQVWQQTDGSALVARTMESPEVQISRGVFGVWYLKVDGYNKQTKVKRIR